MAWWRLWIIASICWILFGIYTVLRAPELSYDQVLSRPVFGQQAISRAEALARQDARAVCVDATISARVYPDPIPLAPNWASNPKLRKAAEYFTFTGSVFDQAKAEADLRERLKQGGPEADFQIAHAFDMDIEQVEPQRNSLTRDALRALWIAAHSEDVGERDARLAQRDFHTHVLSISCLREESLSQRALLATAVILGPPLGALGVVAMFFVLLIPIVRWLAAGFRPAAEVATVPVHSAIQALPKSPSQHPWRNRLPRELQWALVLVIIVAGGAVSCALSGITKSTFADAGRVNSAATYPGLEKELRAQLPKSAGDNVLAVDVAVEDSGLRWTYQRQSPGDLSNSDYLDSVISRACENATVRDVTAHGFSVEYVLIDTSGAPLGGRRVTQC